MSNEIAQGPLPMDNQIVIGITASGRTNFEFFRYPSFDGHLRTGNLMWKVMNSVTQVYNVNGQKTEMTLLEAWREFAGTTRQPVVWFAGFMLSKPFDFITTTLDPEWIPYVRSHTVEVPGGQQGNDDQKT